MKFLKRILDVVAGTVSLAGTERTDQFARREALPPNPNEDPEPVGVGGRVTAGAEHQVSEPYRLEPKDRVYDDDIVVYPDFSVVGTPVDGEIHLRDHIGHLGSTT